MKFKLFFSVASLLFSSFTQAQFSSPVPFEKTYELPPPVRIQLNGITEENCPPEEPSCQVGASLVVLAPIGDRVQFVGRIQHQYDERTGEVELAMEYQLAYDMLIDVRFNQREQTTSAGFSTFF